MPSVGDIDLSLHFGCEFTVLQQTRKDDRNLHQLRSDMAIANIQGARCCPSEQAMDSESRNLVADTRPQSYRPGQESSR